MTIPSSGPMAMGDIALELGLAGNANLGLDDAQVRFLLNIGPSPAAIAISDAYGKSRSPSATVLSTSPSFLSYRNGLLGTIAPIATYKGVTIQEINLVAEVTAGSFTRLELVVPNGFTWGFFQFDFALNNTYYTPGNVGLPPDSTSQPGFTKYAWGGSFAGGAQSRSIKFIG